MQNESNGGPDRRLIDAYFASPDLARKPTTSGPSTHKRFLQDVPEHGRDIALDEVYSVENLCESSWAQAWSIPRHSGVSFGRKPHENK